MNSSPDAPANGGGSAVAACQFARLAGWSSVAVRGADRQSFLNNFCTNDVKRLLSGTSCEAFFCNAKGRVIAHGLITSRDGEHVIIGPPGQGASLAAHLDRYVIRKDVAIQDVTTERIYVLVFGSDVANHLAEAAAVSSIKSPESQGQYWNSAAQIGGANVRWIEWPIAAPESVLTETSPSEVLRVEAWLQAQNANCCGQNAVESARIEAGMPLLGVDFDDRNLPQEVGRDAQAISFTKGCYLGQETVARIDALGHVNQRLVGVRFSGSTLIEPGAELTDAGKIVGHVTSSAFSSTLKAPLALAMGSKLNSPVGACEVIPLPV
jgi:folate-binding protein YgfZ